MPTEYYMSAARSHWVGRRVELKADGRSSVVRDVRQTDGWKNPALDFDYELILEDGTGVHWTDVCLVGPGRVMLGGGYSNDRYNVQVGTDPIKESYGPIRLKIRLPSGEVVAARLEYGEFSPGWGVEIEFARGAEVGIEVFDKATETWKKPHWEEN